VRVLVAERKYREASYIIGGVIRAFEAGGDAALLADALTLRGVIQARLADPDASVKTLTLAMKTAQDAGALTNAGLAALNLIEEHGARKLTEDILLRLYRRAHELLQDTQDAEALARLRECALIVVRRISGLTLKDRNFSLPNTLHDIEARFIEKALKEAKGSVTRAARLLGMPRQSLVNLLKNQHRQLLSKRTPAKQRRRALPHNPSDLKHF
jgi:DNA-binding protein Fis